MATLDPRSAKSQLAAVKKAEAQRAAQQKAEAQRVAQQKAAQQKAAAQQAAQQKAAAQQAAQQKAAQQKAAQQLARQRPSPPAVVPRPPAVMPSPPAVGFGGTPESGYLTPFDRRVPSPPAVGFGGTPESGYLTPFEALMFSNGMMPNQSSPDGMTQYGPGGIGYPAGGGQMAAAANFLGQIPSQDTMRGASSYAGFGQRPQNFSSMGQSAATMLSNFPQPQQGLGPAFGQQPQQGLGPAFGQQPQQGLGQAFGQQPQQGLGQAIGQQPQQNNMFGSFGGAQQPAQNQGPNQQAQRDDPSNSGFGGGGLF